MDKAKQDEEEKQLTRLHDIVVQEVSLVDRAANQRRFLVTKRSDQMGKKLVPDGKGGYIEKADSKDDDDDKAKGKSNDDDAKKAKAKADDDDDDKKADDDDDAKKAKAKAEDDDDDKKADDDDDAKKMKKSQVALLITTAEALAKVAESVNGGGALPDNFVADMTTNLVKIAGEGNVDDAFLAKLDKLSEGLKALKGKGKKADDDDDDDDKRDDDEPTKAEKRLLKLVANLEKKVDDQSETIRKLSEEPGSSNGHTDKGGVKKSGGSTDDVAWPLDMAAEDKLSKEAVEKTNTSFYD